MKDSIKYLPIYGWYFPQHNCVFVRRSGSQRDILDIEKQVEVYPKVKMPVSVMIAGMKMKISIVTAKY